MGWAKGLFINHSVCAHLPSPFMDSFKVSLKSAQGFRRSIHLNLLIEAGRAEAARKLEALERGRICQWVWDQPCCKGAQVRREAGHVFFWQFAVTFVVVSVSLSLPLKHWVSPLDHCFSGHCSLQRGNFSVCHGKCSLLRSPWLGEKPWHRNTHGEPQEYSQLHITGTWQCSTFH